MAENFWKTLKKPIMAMAPMANVTDAAFRRQFAECGKPSVFWTEFVSVEGLLSAGREKLLVDFWHGEDEHPIVAQIFGGKPEQFEEIGALIAELGFDGIDINMGCPDSGVEASGGGASLVRNPALAKQLIRAAKRGSRGLPVSVKTRIGYTKLDEMIPWLTALLEEDIAALTVHLRTRKEMSAVPAHWEVAPQITALRDRIAPKTILLGNGDVDSLEVARAKITESGFDGVMIGRGVFGNPWFFSGHTPSIKEKLERLAAHAELFEKLYRSDQPAFRNSFSTARERIANGFRAKIAKPDEGIPNEVFRGGFGDLQPKPVERRRDSVEKEFQRHGELARGDARNGKDRIKNFEVMKKHFKAYCSGFDDAKELRVKLMECESASEVRKIIEEFLKSFKEI